MDTSFGFAFTHGPMYFDNTLPPSDISFDMLDADMAIIDNAPDVFGDLDTLASMDFATNMPVSHEDAYFYNVNDMDLPDGFILDSSALSSPAMFSPGDFSAQDLSFMTVNSHAHAAPWNPTMPRSAADSSRNRREQIPGQPKHEFIQAAQSNSFGEYSLLDSGYVSAPPADTASMISAPSVVASARDDISQCTSPSSKRAQKRFKCNEPGPHRSRLFANIHDLERHQRTHGIKSEKSAPYHFRCCVQDCKTADKIWDRKDNFRSHIIRKHFGNKHDDKIAIDDLVERSKLSLSAQEIQDDYLMKQATRQESKRVAQKRKAKQLSRLETSHTPHGMSGAISSTASTNEDMDDMFGQVDFGEGEQMLSPTSALSSAHPSSPMPGFMSHMPRSAPARSYRDPNEMWWPAINGDNVL